MVRIYGEEMGDGAERLRPRLLHLGENVSCGSRLVARSVTTHRVKDARPQDDRRRKVRKIHTVSGWLLLPRTHWWHGEVQEGLVEFWGGLL